MTTPNETLDSAQPSTPKGGDEPCPAIAPAATLESTNKDAHAQGSNAAPLPSSQPTSGSGNAETDTPRTDRESRSREWWNEAFDPTTQVWLVASDFARTLERELFTMTAARDAAEAACAVKGDALRKLMRRQSNVEVMGEWSALDINRGLYREERERQTKVIEECELALFSTCGTRITAELAQLRERVAELENTMNRIIAIGNTWEPGARPTAMRDEAVAAMTATEEGK